MSCPLCGYRIPLKKFDRVLAALHGDCAPKFLACYVQKGVKGMFWEEVSPSMDNETVSRWVGLWKNIRVRVSAQMLAWLNRYGLDQHGEPLFVTPKRFSEFNGSVIPLLQHVPVVHEGPVDVPLSGALPLRHEVANGRS